MYTAKRVSTLVFTTAVLSLAAGWAIAQTHKDPAKNAAGDQDAEMRAMHEKAAKPGPEHATLAKRAGEYTTATKAWMKPGDPPQESNGTARLSMVLGGRFLHEEDEGNFMGQPTQGARIYGYNVIAEQYEAAWTYNHQTAMMTMTGTSKDGGKTVNYDAGFASAKGQRVPFAITVRQLDDDRFSVEMVARQPDGSHGARFETTYTRKKAGAR